MTGIPPSEFPEADVGKFDKVNGEYFVKTTVNNSLIQSKFDYIAATYPTGTTEVYTYKLGGASGTVVGTITVTYTDSTKALVSSVQKA